MVSCLNCCSDYIVCVVANRVLRYDRSLALVPNLYRLRLFRLPVMFNM